MRACVCVCGCVVVCLWACMHGLCPPANVGGWITIQLDSRKTFKLFQDAQRHVQATSKKLADERREFAAQLTQARAAYDGAVGKNAAHV